MFAIKTELLKDFYFENKESFYDVFFMKISGIPFAAKYLEREEMKQKSM